MIMRIGTVEKIYPTTGKVKVMYEDARTASLPLAMLTMNQEYSMPTVGDRVITMHMQNGSSKGFVLGTYYGGGMQPKANSGYRKDFGAGAYVTCRSGLYRLTAKKIEITGNGESSLSLSTEAALIGTCVTIGSAAGSEDDMEEIEPDVFLKLMEEEAELNAISGISILSESGAVEIISEESDSHFILNRETEMKAMKIKLESEEMILKCSYGEENFENILKRIERIEDRLGLPHTV